MLNIKKKLESGEYVECLPQKYRGYFLRGTRITEGIMFKAQTLNEDVYIFSQVNKRRTYLDQLFDNKMNEDIIPWNEDLIKSNQKMLTLFNTSPAVDRWHHITISQ